MTTDASTANANAYLRTKVMSASPEELRTLVREMRQEIATLRATLRELRREVEGLSDGDLADGGLSAEGLR